MTPTQMIEQIERCGFHLEVDGSDIVVSPSGRLTDPQRQFIREHKQDILAALTAANDGQILVQAWTPNGDMLVVEARDQAHAEWIQRMNPAPKP